MLGGVQQGAAGDSKPTRAADEDEGEVMNCRDLRLTEFTIYEPQYISTRS